MAISFVTNALVAGNPTTSFSVVLPTTQADDIIILEYTHRGSGAVAPGGTSVTTGGLTWANKHSQLYASSAFSGHTYWTRATGDHAGQTVTGTGLTNSCAAIVTVYRGATTSGDPLSDATVVGEQNASANETQAQITTATNGAWVVLVVANSPDVAVTSCACTSPGALTNRAEKLSTGGTDTSIVHASAEKATAGATGSFTWAQTDGASGSWAYAIKPDTNLTLALTGEASTVSAGDVDNAADRALTGEASTSAAGTVTAEVDEGESTALTGSAFTAEQGSVDNESAVPAAGEEASAEAGDVTPDVSAAVSGSEIASATGTLIAEGGETQVALSGQSMTASAGNVSVAQPPNPGRSRGGRPRRVIVRRVEEDDEDYFVQTPRKVLKPKKVEVDLRTRKAEEPKRVRQQRQLRIPAELLKTIDLEDDDEWMLM